MDLQMKSSRSLPPLVEGKIHGSLRLVINEVLWIRKSPGDVTVVASWWGEHDNAQFRPRDSATGTERTSENTTEVYAIKTNAILFEDYIKNCDAIELVIIAENTHDVIGRGHVGDLSKIFSCRYYSQFIPILSNDSHEIGKLYVSLQLVYLAKLLNTPTKTRKNNKKENILLFAINNLQCEEKMPVRSRNNVESTEEKKSVKSEKIDTCNTYGSVLKSKRSESRESKKKMNEVITGELVTQIVARAQHLREAILKETYKEDSSTLSDQSDLSNGSPSNATSENKIKLYKYMLGMEMTSSEEKEVLNTLRSISPNLRSADLTSKMTTTDRDDNTNVGWNKNFLIQLDNPKEDPLGKSETCTELKETYPLDYVNSIRLFIESFTLTSAGYRRAKSTCLQYDVPLSLTYFIQYDTTCGFIKQISTKSSKETKFIRTCAKKQVGQVVNFNSEGIFRISRHNIKKNLALRFKVFVKHRNQKFPNELGFGVMNVNDITSTTNLSSVQCIAIVNKSIKMGELKIMMELGCDFNHFGKEFIDAVMSKKENLPGLKKNSLMNSNSKKYKSATGTHSSKSNCKVSSVSAKRIECLTSNSNKDIIITKDILEHQQQSLDNKKIDTSNPESDTKDKVLLHGLIYVAEGKDLLESNTYLICRAFWREDKATSQICNNTKNPFYHFFQLVPLIHGTELLERIRDNYIIIEVYNRQNSGTDNLLGIAKLPVHQLYIAYRDPLILPHLLLSKYPVISVDGWVNINDPVSGKFCGKLLALVALGTVEQIALLEVSRGLRNTNNMSRTDYNYHCCVPDNTNNAIGGQESSQYNVPGVSNPSSEQFTRSNNFSHVYNTPDQDLASVDYKTQESQTDISSLKNATAEKPTQEAVFSEQLALRTLVDRLTNVLDIDKVSTNQSAQTEINQVDEGEIHGELCLNTLNSNSLADDSDSCNPKNDFRLSTEMHRSVGVGAEYNEDLDQRPNSAYNNVSNASSTERNAPKVESNINCNGSFFRSVIEIECALHLPRIEEPNESVEPSTYVTFQNLTRKFDSTDQLNSYIATNVFLHSCNPKWNWRCDVKLSTDLLLNNQKRLILKVWHLIDPDTSKEINLKRDIVIGFSAIDLSVLMAGFPAISGWFHIMDFTGKCNGQIKISITPLDNLSLLGKLAPTNTNLSRCSNLSEANGPHPYNALCTNTELNGAHQTLSSANQNNDKYVQNDCRLNVETGHNLEDVSMSFLSSSLKQKLTELDEITKRLQSRLRDVTNAAFDDEFDNDFDIIEPNSDNENTNDKNIETAQSAVLEYSNNGTSQMSKQCEIQNDRDVSREICFSSCPFLDCSRMHQPYLCIGAFMNVNT
ncbi:PREDICTED: C2 domain-containing protein 3 isoform X2 [Vollenhovia emeryi]|uniref:C2 domain-containing protein 3 isoform X2 n=1 Tax=Vollenhovia emeryi TaxID=411798 RepID=UPI0005F3EBBF|nr:PREDICTED: C2 domain-containing protein 3 isoform X2 [Vollenhovia emeryi]